MPEQGLVQGVAVLVPLVAVPINQLGCVTVRMVAIFILAVLVM